MVEEALFVGGPCVGYRRIVCVGGYIDWSQIETPVRDASPDPWKYNEAKRAWVCRYTRRRQFSGTLIYAPQEWTNADVLAELIRGYKP